MNILDTAIDLLVRAKKALARAHHQYRIKHAIHVTKRDLDLTEREIADRVLARSHLRQHLNQLKAAERSLPQ